MEEQQIVQKRKIYQAIGIISGMLELTQSQYSSLTVGEHTYSVTVSRNVQKKHESGQIQSFKVYPSIIEGKLGFNLLRVIEEAPERVVMFLKGCWTIYREEPRLIIYRNSKDSDTKTVLELIWDEAPVPTMKRRYWEIEAELKGEKFEVIQAIGPFAPPRKSFGKKPIGSKSDVPRPILKSAKSEIAPFAPKAIDSPESEPIPKTTSEPIAFNANQAIEETTVAAKAVDVIEPIVTSESQEIVESPTESIKPEEPEESPVVVEAVTPKKKKAVSKSPASKKLSKLSEATEPKKTKEKVKSSRSKKPMSLAADRLFLGKQLPSGK